MLNLPKQKAEKCESKIHQEEQEIVLPSRPTRWLTTAGEIDEGELISWKIALLTAQSWHPSNLTIDPHESILNLFILPPISVVVRVEEEKPDNIYLKVCKLFTVHQVVFVLYLYSVCVWSVFNKTKR